MAEDLGQFKTEAPSQRRRDEARQQGQISYSSEFASGLQLLAGVIGLWWGGRTLAGGLLDSFRIDLQSLTVHEFGPEQARGLFAFLLIRAGGLVGFFVGLMLVTGLASSTLQVGFHITPELAMPRWSRISPGAGWSRILSAAAGMRGVMAILKVTVVAAVAAWVLRGRIGQIASVGEGTLASALSQGWEITLRLALAVGASLVIIGLADFTYQRLRHEHTLLMTRQELKEETKREEGDPQIRARMRRVAREIARQHMMQDVPRATVVITNPTHLAIALRYERGVTSAPRVVAKGAGAVAQRIVALARDHAVPVVERKPLARALFKAAKVGQNIPTALYHAVAEVLAFVYRLRSAA